MTIRNKLALRFMLLASLILGGAFVIVYMMSSRYRIEEFRERIHDRGVNTANIFLKMGDVDRSFISDMEMRNPTLVPSEAIRIYNAADQLLYSSGNWRLQEVTPAVIQQVRAQDEIVDLEKGGEAIGFEYAGKGDPLVILISGIDRFGRSKLNNLGQVMLVTFGFGVLITFLIGRVYAERALHPIQDLVSQVKNIHAGNLLQRVELGKEKDEIWQLAVSFNELLDRLERAFNAQRSFIANASHELRTPLTVITGQLEVLLLSDRSTEAYKAAVASVMEDMRSLNKLANRLLLLAQTDNFTTENQVSPVRLDEVIWQVRAELLRSRPEINIDVNMAEVDDERFMQVMGNENLLRSLVLNLIENGCKYSPDKRVEVSLHIMDGIVKLDLADRGIGIPESDLAKIFRPFFRGSNAAGYPGHGIGLSLVRRIAEIHGGDVHVQRRGGGGTLFTVTLPHM
jgi:signal transduction histidine kinase